MTVTAKPALLYQDVVPDGTLSLTAGTLDAATPLTNLADPWVSKPVRFTSSTVTIKLTMGTAPTWSYLALVGVGGASDATIRWIVDGDIAGGAPFAWDSGTVSAFDFSRPEITGAAWPVGGRHVLVFPPSAAVGDEMELVYNPGTSPSSKSIGALRAGKVWQPDLWMTTTWELETGSTRTWRMTIETDRDGASEIASFARAHQRGERLMLVPRPLSEAEWIREVIYCSLVETPVEIYRSGTTRRFRMFFREVLT